ncbi:MAG: nucleoside triphosphate pyrophosphohydrolase [Firmicutes bacterium]|nr:nucleoside triphosphate pyrophosphohydrolase [Bacillota bacterium]
MKVEGSTYPLDPLVRVMEGLLAEDGCPWDREQTHLSLRRYLLEESYEVIEAIEEGDMHKLCEELGDLLLQIVFHAALAQARGEFSLTEVVEGITAKMIRRHPHVFAAARVKDSAQVQVNWEEIKGQERGRKEGDTVLAGIPVQLPALMRALKLQEKAARVGFDWDSAQGAFAKVEEELLELKEAADREDAAAVEEELGDLLFAVVNVARFLLVEPETALTRTNAKFTRRFRYIEGVARQEGRDLKDLTLAEMDKLWEQAKENGKLCEKPPREAGD